MQKDRNYKLPVAYNKVIVCCNNLQATLISFDIWKLTVVLKR